MTAFQGAKELGADWIELDVQQSRDGQLFVMHDTNFMRTAGVDQNTWEMDYDEIRNLDVGSFFDSRFAGERVPLLSEVLAFAKENGIKLNIEVKPAGHEHEFEQKVAEIIETEELLVDFNEKLLHRLVNYATVYSSGRVVFTFRNRADISTKI